MLSFERSRTAKALLGPTPQQLAGAACAAVACTFNHHHLHPMPSEERGQKRLSRSTSCAVEVSSFDRLTSFCGPMSSTFPGTNSSFCAPSTQLKHLNFYLEKDVS